MLHYSIFASKPFTCMRMLCYDIIQTKHSSRSSQLDKRRKNITWLLYLCLEIVKYVGNVVYPNK